MIQDLLHFKQDEVYPLAGRYSGQGGGDDGAHQAGMFTMFAADLDKHSVDSFRLNHPTSPIYQADVTRMSAEETLQLACIPEGKEFGYLTTPSCQGGSQAGKCDPYNPLNRLMLNEPWFISQLRPAFFVFENVPGIQHGRMKFLKAMLAHEVEEHLTDYEVRECVLNTAHYRIPQDRKRYIMLGFRKDLNIIPEFPEPSLDIVTVKDVLPYIDAIAYAYNFRKVRSADRPSNTITKTENIRKIIDGKIEKLTIEELRILCGYPEDWKTEGSVNKVY